MKLISIVSSGCEVSRLLDSDANDCIFTNYFKRLTDNVFPEHKVYSISETIPKSVTNIPAKAETN